MRLVCLMSPKDYERIGEIDLAVLDGIDITPIPWPACRVGKGVMIRWEDYQRLVNA